MQNVRIRESMPNFMLVRKHFLHFEEVLMAFFFFYDNAQNVGCGRRRFRSIFSLATNKERFSKVVVGLSNTNFMRPLSVYICWNGKGYFPIY